MALEKEEEVFSTNEEHRQAARLKKLQVVEAKIQEELKAEMKEREELRKERAKNRQKLSALSSSGSSSSALPITKRNIGFSYGFGPDDIPA
jgi:predicted PP-loop superfamily ATPase